MSGLRIGALFAGYGGLDMAVQDVWPDAELAWYSEIDKGACKILAHRFPDVPNVGDVTAVDWSQVEPVDVITGGSPCQDLSHAGRRAGMTEGTRSNLWVAMREAIAQLRPKAVIWENVRGAYSAGADSELESDARLLAGVRRRDGEPVLRALGRVLGDLSDLGYVGGWHGLRAADVGAPHGRFRVFVVATNTSGPRLRQYAGGTSAQEAWTDESDQPAGHGAGEHASLTLLPTPASSAGEKGRAYGQDPEIRRRLGRQVELADITCWEMLGRTRLLPTPRATDGTKGGPNQAGSSGDLMLPSAVQPARWGDYAAAIARWEHTLGRPAPAPTMTSAKGNPQLSPAFVEWLMGLPAGHITDVPGITRNEALKACGNGVVPQQAAAAIRWLLAQGVAA